MKKLFYLFLFVLLAAKGHAAIKVAHANDYVTSVQLQENIADQPLGGLSKMAKKESKQKMGFFKKMKMKLVQKLLKKKTKKGSDMPKGAYIVLSIFWLGWLAMGLLDDWNGDNWWVCLILYILFWLPGFIFSMIKMGDYY